jgi:hypothetical protein
MTGNVFRDDRRRADLIMDAAKVEMIKTDDPFTQIKEKRGYYSPDDPASITDAFDRDYGVLSDEEAATILEQNQEAIQQPTPVINPEPTPAPTPDPEPTANPIIQIAQKALEQSQIKKSGREAHMGNSKFKMKNRVANREKAKAMAKARKASSSSSSSSKSSSKGGGTSGGSRGSSSKSQGRGGARGGAKGGSAGRGASSKGGTSRGGARTNRSRSRRRCDIRCKFDISLLSNMNLIRDDLAEIAYFVKEINN